MTSATPRSFRLRGSLRARIALISGHLLAGLGWAIAGPGAIALLAGLIVIGLSLALTLRRPTPTRLATDGRGVWTVEFTDRRTCRGIPGTIRLLPGLIAIAFAAPGGPGVALFHDAFRDADHSAARLLLRHGPRGPRARIAARRRV